MPPTRLTGALFLAFAITDILHPSLVPSKSAVLYRILQLARLNLAFFSSVILPLSRSR
jgi:hypothetical protein